MILGNIYGLQVGFFFVTIKVHFLRKAHFSRGKGKLKYISLYGVHQIREKSGGKERKESCAQYYSATTFSNSTKRGFGPASLVYGCIFLFRLPFSLQMGIFKLVSTFFSNTKNLLYSAERKPFCQKISVSRKSSKRISKTETPYNDSRAEAYKEIKTKQITRNVKCILLSQWINSVKRNDDW